MKLTKNITHRLFSFECKAKAKASALYIVIVISLVIGILTSALILVGYHYKLQIYDTILLKKLETNLNSGVNLVLAETDFLTFDERKVFDLYEEGEDSIEIKKQHWGLFETSVIRSYAKRFELKKGLMYGYEPDETSKCAIYLVDNARPLSLSGKTFIKGTCFLPESGIERAYIESQSFIGDKLIHGEVKKSKNTLPPLNKEFTESIAKIFKKEGEFGEEEFEVISSAENDTIIRSFLEKTLVIKTKSKLTLSDCYYSGNIIVVSDTVIEIDKTAQLIDIIVYAAGINIQDGFKGSLQAFVKDSLITGEECEFKYPSAFGVFKVDYQVNQPFIKLGKKTKFSGIIFSFKEVSDLEETLIQLNEETEVEGQVYADGYVDLKGKVFGNVTCNKFTLKTPSNIYDNHLLNVTVDQTALSPYFVGSSIVSSKKKKKIIKWLE